MKTTPIAIVLVATLAQPAAAITFPKLTTIYVGAGAFDDSSLPDNVGTSTVVICSNVSGVTANIRVLMIDSNGIVRGSLTGTGVAHGDQQSSLLTLSLHSWRVTSALEGSLEWSTSSRRSRRCSATQSSWMRRDRSKTLSRSTSFA